MSALVAGVVSRPQSSRRARRGRRRRHRRRHGLGRHVDVGGRLARRPHARRSISRAASGRCRRPAARRRASPTSSTTRGSRRGRPTAARSRSSPIATAATTCGRSRPTASNQRKLTVGAFDDREPVWSHDGTRIAFSSDRGRSAGQRLQHLGARRGAAARCSQLTTQPGRGLDAELVARRRRHRVRVDARRRAATCGRCRRTAAPSARSRTSAGRVDAAVVGARRPDRAARARGPARAGSSWAARRSPAARTSSRSVPSWASATEFFYTADGKIRRARRRRAELHRRALHRDAAGDAGALHARRARLRLAHAAQGARASCGRCSRPTARRWRLPRSATSG